MVRVKPTHRMWSLFGRVFARFSGWLVICANCGKELRVDAHGVSQTLRGPQAMPAVPSDENGEPARTELRMRDPDQLAKWKRR